MLRPMQYVATSEFGVHLDILSLRVEQHRAVDHSDKVLEVLYLRHSVFDLVVGLKVKAALVHPSQQVAEAGLSTRPSLSTDM